MKTTIEIDDEKLDKIMTLSGIGTRKDAVDWALTEGVRLATMNAIEKNPWTLKETTEAVDPDYDIIAIRHGSVDYRKTTRKK
jgi:Arc/MetJ family transcription regulator